jgi:LmbE family N-acetylglucosaminyl deacetylase
VNGRALRRCAPLALGRSRSALVVAPHPDDEVIGAYGLIARLRRAGVRVRVLVVTDGAASHPRSRRWPRARLVQQRRRESRWALARLGVPAGDIAFLGLPDGGLEAAGREAETAIARAVRRRPPFDLLVGPLPGDDHPDHRAVARALAGARPRVRRLGYPVWPAPEDRRARTLRVPGGAAAKRWAVRLHRTQGGLITDDPQGFALSPAQLARFCQGVERFVELGR